MQGDVIVRRIWSVLGLLCALVAISLPAKAHEIRPSIADFALLEEGRYELKVQANLEAMMTGIGAQHSDTDEAENAGAYNTLRLLEPAELRKRFTAFEPRLRELFKLDFGTGAVEPDTILVNVPEVGDTDLARDSTLVFSGALPEGASTLTWRWPQAFGASVIRMMPAEGVAEGYSAYLSAGEVSGAIPLTGADPRAFLEVVWEYIVIGFTHILPKGLDHILFVVGLFLLSTKLSALIWQVSAFTLAHTVTLALGVLGYVSISPAIVEPLIALSIAYVAIENILTDKLHKWRPVIVFCFGLLHGLGFAGVLAEIGLSQSYFITGLIAFNVGVELGQLAVIAICFALVGIWFGRKPWYRRLIVIPASVLIAVIALWWVYERIFLGG
jgi:hypothetical protein